MKPFILYKASHFVHMALLLSVIGLGACGKNHSTAGKTTTTTNGLAFLDTHGTVRTDVFLRVVPQAYSRGNNTAAVDTVFPNEQGYFDIAVPGNNRDSWPFVELRNRRGDSAITWQNFAPNSDSVLAVELVPIVSVTGTLPSKWRTNEGLYEGYENHEGQEGYKLVVLHSDYSATVGVDGKYQLELPLQKDWIVLGWDNPDSTGSYVSLIRKDTTGIYLPKGRNWFFQ
jgi:hypothetical protein